MLTTIPEYADIQDDIGWARFWLEIPAADLPNKLTRESVEFVLEQAMIDMQLYYGEARA